MNKRPSLSQLKRGGKIWWAEINGAWVKCIPYNIKEEEVAKPTPQGGDDLNDKQFEKIMNRFDSMATKEDLKIVEAKVDTLEVKVDAIDAKVDALSAIVKKNHPEDFN